MNRRAISRDFGFWPRWWSPPKEEEGGPKELLPTESMCSSTRISAPNLPHLTEKGQRKQMKCRYCKGCAHLHFWLVQLRAGMGRLFMSTMSHAAVLPPGSHTGAQVSRHCGMASCTEPTSPGPCSSGPGKHLLLAPQGWNRAHQQLKLHHCLQFVLDQKKSISMKNKGYESEHTHTFEHMRANGFSIGCSGRPMVLVNTLIHRTHMELSS